MKCAALVFQGGALGPFSYVMPGPPTDDAHVAYFSAPRSPPGETVVEIANATFGWRDGAPFVHCHGAWIEEGTHRRGGHMLPHETIVARATTVHAWALPDVAIRAEPDPETNFTCSVRLQRTRATAGDRTIVARIRPNEDITAAIEAIAQPPSHARRDRARQPRQPDRRPLHRRLAGCKITPRKCWCAPATSIMARPCWICSWWTWQGTCTRAAWCAATIRSASLSSSCWRLRDVRRSARATSAHDTIPVAGPAADGTAARSGTRDCQSRSSSQRQSALCCSMIHTGLPSAPARCATDVSIVITRSSNVISAAVSAKSANVGAVIDQRWMRGQNSRCAGGISFCNEWNSASGD